jgi:DNA-directed RNA polymerase beta' subunit
MLLKDLKSCVSGVNDCHIRLLVDKMTFKGKPASMTRYTMKINDVGPLSKATFEQSVDVIQSAAFKGEIDDLKGISSAIVSGNHVRIGTGMVDLLVDLDKLLISRKEENIYY